MKKFLLALIIIFGLVPYLNANERKNVFVSSGLSLLLPGGGFAYLNYPEDSNKYDSKALTYVTIELGLLSWIAHESMINKGEDEDISIVPLTMFFAVKLAEAVEVSIKTREHNRKVKPSYSLESKIHNDKVNLHLVYKF